MAQIKNEAAYRAAMKRVEQLEDLVDDDNPTMDENALELDMLIDMTDHGVGSTDHFSALKIWMFENKFVSLPSHLKTIEPMEVHRESRTMCNTETSKVISRTDPMINGGKQRKSLSNSLTNRL